MINVLEALRRTVTTTIRRGVAPPANMRASMLGAPAAVPEQRPQELVPPPDAPFDTFFDTSMWVRRGGTTFYPYDMTGYQYSGIIIGDAAGGDMGPGTINAMGLFQNGSPIGPPFGASAPSDGNTYALNSGMWVKVVEEAGGNMTGPLYLPPANPTAPNQAVHKQYVDQQIAAGTLPDAPADGKLYGRKDEQWVADPVTEAPVDGRNYSRTNGAWFGGMDGGNY